MHPSRPARLTAHLMIMRPVGQIVLGASTVLGELVVLAAVPSSAQIVFGFFTFFFLTGASFVLNDYVDVDIDRVNSPERPLPAGLVTRRAALYMTVILSVAGLVVPLFLSIYAFAVASLTFALSVIYSFYGKQTGFIGNLMVATYVSVPFLFGAIIVDKPIAPTLLMIFLLAFLSNTGREITKGIADARGDRIKNIHSFAIVYGPKSAAILAAVFFMSTAIAGPALALTTLQNTSALLIPPVLFVELGFLYSSAILIRNPTGENALKVNKQANLWMILFVVIFLIETIATGNVLRLEGSM